MTHGSTVAALSKDFVLIFIFAENLYDILVYIYSGQYAALINNIRLTWHLKATVNFSVLKRKNVF
jgi:hypothetical protein